MGIDIEWKMVQGAPYKKWEEVFKGDPQIEDQFDGDFNWFLYEGIGLVSVSPWYDADPEDCVFGIELAMAVMGHGILGRQGYQGGGRSARHAAGDPAGEFPVRAFKM